MASRRVIAVFDRVQAAIREFPDIVANAHVVVQIRIKPDDYWFINLKVSGGQVQQGVFPSPDCTLTYSSRKAFLDIADGKSDPKRAFLTGKVSFSGDRSSMRSVMERVAPLFQELQKRQEAADNAKTAGASTPSQRSGWGSSPAPSEAGSEVVDGEGGLVHPQSQSWMADHESQHCTGCGAKFGILRRRHHCRFCGGLFDDSCSSHVIHGKRACDVCFFSWSQSPSPLNRRHARQLRGSRLTRSMSSMGLLPRGSRQDADRSRLYSQPESAFWQSGGGGGGVARTAASSDSGGESAAAAATATATAGAAATDAAAADAGPGAAAPAAAGSRALTAATAVSPSGGDGSSSDGGGADDMNLVFERLLELEKSLDRVTGARVGESRIRDSLARKEARRIQGRAARLALRTLIALCAYAYVWNSPLALLAAAVLLLTWQWLVHSSSLAARQAAVFYTAITFMVTYTMTQRRLRHLPPESQEAEWESTHTVFAHLLYDLIVRLQGFWVKTGQFLSSRADVVPAPFVKILSQLQDSLPPKPMDQIYQQVEAALGEPVSSAFASFDSATLGTASIAQVHRATLHDGTEVVVKVQHLGIHKVMEQDLRNLSTITKWVAWLQPSLDFTAISREWNEAATRELDFRFETEAMEEVRLSLPACLNVVVPEAIPGMCKARVMVMKFERGFKITDSKKLDDYGVDRVQLTTAVLRAFAYQLHVGGLFNADPHPGNILVQVPRSWEEGGNRDGDSDGCNIVRPVLLDFGLVKRLKTRTRIALARMVYSAYDMDTVSLLASLGEMGFVFKQGSVRPAENMGGALFMFRDTAPPKDARQRFMDYGDKVRSDVEARNAGTQNPVTAWPEDIMLSLRVTDLMQGLCSQLAVRLPFLEIFAPFAKQALLAQYPPPSRAGCLVLPHRNHRASAVPATGAPTEHCVWPTAQQMDTAPSPLPLLANAQGGSGNSGSTDSGSGSASLSSKVRALLHRLAVEGDITGCQVAVYRGGKLVLSECAGVLGPVDPRPVLPDTLFCCLGATKGVLAAAVAAAVHGGHLSYNDRVADHWPQFAANGKGECRVSHVMSHRAGLPHTLPSDLQSPDLLDVDAMVELVAQAHPVFTPGSHTSFHYLTYGWLVAGLLKASTGTSLSSFLATAIAEPLRIQQEFMLGLPPLSAASRPSFAAEIEKARAAGSSSGCGVLSGANSGSDCPNTDRVATLSNGLVGTLRDLMGGMMMAAQRQEQPTSQMADFLSGIRPLSAPAAPTSSGESKDGSGDSASAVGSGSGAVGLGLAASWEAAMRQLKGNENLVDPRVFNREDVARTRPAPAQEGEAEGSGATAGGETTGMTTGEKGVPAMTGFFSARALARFYAMLAAGGTAPAPSRRRRQLLSPAVLQQATAVVATEGAAPKRALDGGSAVHAGAAAGGPTAMAGTVSGNLSVSGYCSDGDDGDNNSDGGEEKGGPEGEDVYGSAADGHRLGDAQGDSAAAPTAGGDQGGAEAWGDAGGDYELWGMGFSVFPIRGQAGGMRLSAFGHAGFGGSLAFADPAAPGGELAVAVTVNQLTLSRTATHDLVNLIMQHYGAGQLLLTE